jgi:hypothetical protein
VIQRQSFKLSLIISLIPIVLIYAPSFAEDTALISIGPRVGFTGKSPFLGKEQKYNFHLYDVAAVFRLPWSWPLGEDGWRLETRLITTAGYLAAAGDSGFMGTVLPDLALSAWKGLVTVDVGLGVGFFSTYKFGEQDFGGPVQVVGTAGISVHPMSHAYAGFRVQHFSDATLYGTSSLGVDMYIVEIGYKF